MFCSDLRPLNPVSCQLMTGLTASLKKAQLGPATQMSSVCWIIDLSLNAETQLEQLFLHVPGYYGDSFSKCQKTLELFLESSEISNLKCSSFSSFQSPYFEVLNDGPTTSLCLNESRDQLIRHSHIFNVKNC